MELERWSCPAGHTFDVYLEDGVPEDVEKTRCPICIPAILPDGRVEHIYGVPNRAETELFVPEDWA